MYLPITFISVVQIRFTESKRHRKQLIFIILYWRNVVNWLHTKREDIKTVSD